MTCLIWLIWLATSNNELPRDEIECMSDPNEWTNIAGKPEMDTVTREIEEHLKKAGMIPALTKEILQEK